MMRRIALVLVGCLALAGCASSDRSVFEGGISLTAPVAQPVDRNTLAQIESAYGLAVTLAVAYRRLPLCRTGENASFARICAERPIVVRLQQANRHARIALLAARRLAGQPTVNAIEVFAVARQAVGEFRALAESLPQPAR